MPQVEQIKFLSRKWLAAKRDKEHSCWYSNRKRLEVKLSQHPTEWQVVIISSAAALLSRLEKGTGLVSGPLHPHVARLFFFLIWVPTIGNKLYSLHNFYHFGVLFVWAVIKFCMGWASIGQESHLPEATAVMIVLEEEEGKSFSNDCQQLLPAFWISEKTAGADTCCSPSSSGIISNC